MENRRIWMFSMSEGRVERTWSILSRICIEAMSMLVPVLNWRWIMADEDEDVELRLSKLLTVARTSSRGRVIVRSTPSGDDDG